MKTKYGRLRILHQISEAPAYYCEVRCRCGKVKTVRLYNILSGRTQSCGCLHAEISSSKMAKYNRSSTRDKFGRNKKAA